MPGCQHSEGQFQWFVSRTHAKELMKHAGWDCVCDPVAAVLQVAMVGSGAWACAAMHIVAQNCAAFDEADEVCRPMSCLQGPA